MTRYIETDRENYLPDILEQFNTLRERMIEIRNSLTEVRDGLEALVTKYNADSTEIRAGVTAIITKLNADAGVTDTDYVDGFTAAGSETAAVDGLTQVNDLAEDEFTGIDIWTAIDP